MSYLSTCLLVSIFLINVIMQQFSEEVLLNSNYYNFLLFSVHVCFIFIPSVFEKKCTYLFLFCKLCSVSLLLLFFVFWYCFASFFVCFCLLLCLCSYSVWACFLLLLLLLLSFLSCFLVLPGKYEVLSMQVNLKCFFGDWNGLNALDHFAPYLLMFPILLDHIFASMSLIFFCFCV